MTHGRIQWGAWNRRRRVAKNESRTRSARCDHFLFTARTFGEIYDRSRRLEFIVNNTSCFLCWKFTRARIRDSRGFNEEEGTDRLKLFLLYRSMCASSINTKSTKLIFFFSLAIKKYSRVQTFLTRTKHRFESTWRADWLLLRLKTHQLVPSIPPTSI